MLSLKVYRPYQRDIVLVASMSTYGSTHRLILDNKQVYYYLCEFLEYNQVESQHQSWKFHPN